MSEQKKFSWLDPAVFREAKARMIDYKIRRVMARINKIYRAKNGRFK